MIEGIKMKICFFGIGSIGKRHIINLSKVARKLNIELEIHAFRNKNKKLDRDIESLLSQEIFLERNLHDDYDITFITNPTHLHFNSIKLMANKTKHMFIEKPIFEKCDYKISELGLNDNNVYRVATPLRFTNVIKTLKKILVNEDIYSVRVISSSYLPNWRPGIDYRNVYSAKKSEGGGVSIDLIHEWDYITYLFGFPKEVYNLNGKYSHLEISSDDLSIYIAKYDYMLLELHLDYFGRENKRELEIFTKKGKIIGDFLNNSIKFLDNKHDIEFADLNEDMYLEEMEYFLKSVINNNKQENNIRHAYEVLKIAKGEN